MSNWQQHVFQVNLIAFDIWNYCDFPSVLCLSAVHKSWKYRIWPIDQNVQRTIMDEDAYTRESDKMELKRFRQRFTSPTARTTLFCAQLSRCRINRACTFLLDFLPHCTTLEFLVKDSQLPPAFLFNFYPKLTALSITVPLRARPQDEYNKLDLWSRLIQFTIRVNDRHVAPVDVGLLSLSIRNADHSICNDWARAGEALGKFALAAPNLQDLFIDLDASIHLDTAFLSFVTPFTLLRNISIHCALGGRLDFQLLTPCKHLVSIELLTSNCWIMDQGPYLVNIASLSLFRSLKLLTLSRQWTIPPAKFDFQAFKMIDIRPNAMDAFHSLGVACIENCDDTTQFGKVHFDFSSI